LPEEIELESAHSHRWWNKRIINRGILFLAGGWSHANCERTSGGLKSSSLCRAKEDFEVGHGLTTVLGPEVIDQFLAGKLTLDHLGHPIGGLRN
jgi:hypothetical protein